MKVSGISNFGIPKNYLHKASAAFKGVISADPTCGSKKQIVSIPTRTIDEYMIDSEDNNAKGMTSIYIKTNSKKPDSTMQNKFYCITVPDKSKDNAQREKALLELNRELADAFKDGAVFYREGSRIRSVEPMDFSNMLKNEEMDAFKKNIRHK